MSSSASLALVWSSWVEKSFMLINILVRRSFLIKNAHVRDMWTFVLVGTQVMIHNHRGDGQMRLSLSSLVEHLEEFLVPFLENLIPNRHFVAMSFKLFDFSLKSNLFPFPPSLPRAGHEGCPSVCYGFLHPPCWRRMLDRRIVYKWWKPDRRSLWE